MNNKQRACFFQRLKTHSNTPERKVYFTKEEERASFKQCKKKKRAIRMKAFGILLFRGKAEMDPQTSC